MSNAITKTSAGLIGAATLALGAPAGASELRIEVTLPELQVASYYRPYLAAWIEDPATQDIHGTVAVWYDTRLRDNLGAGFLRDLRRWWRNAGESMTLPADGISGPTRGPGTHEITLPGGEGVLSGLEPGDYVLAVEVSRENGGRELLRAPFAWGQPDHSAEVGGSKEIDRLKVAVTR